MIKVSNISFKKGVVLYTLKVNEDYCQYWTVRTLLAQHLQN